MTTTTTTTTPKPENFEMEVVKRKAVYTRRRDRFEIRFRSRSALFPLRERDLGAIRAFEEEQARNQGLDPHYKGGNIPAPGLTWCESEPMYIGKLFADLTGLRLALIDVYSYKYEKTKEVREQKVIEDVVCNVLVYQRDATTSLDASVLAEPVIQNISKAGFEFGAVFANLNQDPETGQEWRCDVLELSKPTARSGKMRSLRTNDCEGNFTYALEESDLPPKKERLARTFDEWVEVAVNFATRDGAPERDLKKWRGAEVRMAAAVKLGLNLEDYRFSDADEEGK
jgi:hypothetical protein